MQLAEASSGHNEAELCEKKLNFSFSQTQMCPFPHATTLQTMDMHTLLHCHTANARSLVQH